MKKTLIICGIVTTVILIFILVIYFFSNTAVKKVEQKWTTYNNARYGYSIDIPTFAYVDNDNKEDSKIDITFSNTISPQLNDSGFLYKFVSKAVAALPPYQSTMSIQALSIPKSTSIQNYIKNNFMVTNHETQYFDDTQDNERYQHQCWSLKGSTDANYCEDNPLTTTNINNLSIKGAKESILYHEISRHDYKTNDYLYFILRDFPEKSENTMIYLIYGSGYYNIGHFLSNNDFQHVINSFKIINFGNIPISNNSIDEILKSDKKICDTRSNECTKEKIITSCQNEAQAIDFLKNREIKPGTPSLTAYYCPQKDLFWIFNAPSSTFPSWYGPFSSLLIQN